MKHTSIYVWLNIVGYLGVILVNYLANALPIGGRTTGDISDMFPVLVTPASYAFSIWGLIYVLLGILVISQLFPRWRNTDLLGEIGPWFFVSSILNMTWIVLWHQLYIVASVFIMIGLLLTLIVIYQRIHANELVLGGADRFLFQLPFSIYLGWISVATILNISIALYAVDWGGWGLRETSWAVIVLILASLLALWMLDRHRDRAFALTIVWALMAIGVKQSDQPVVSWTAWFMALGILLLVLMLRFGRYKDILNKEE